MRLLLSITALIMAAACERAPTPLSGAPGSATQTGAPAPPVAREAATTALATPAVPAAAPAAAMPSADALTDAAITDRVRNALASDPGMAGADVSINTDHGVVVLAGTVKSHEQTGIASAHAQGQDGVLRVDNHLRPALS